MPRNPKVLYIGTNRFVAAIDPRTGEESWRTRLPHGASSIVTLLIEGGNLFVGLAGHVYCLNRRTGEIIWKNGLPKMGYHPVLLAMEGAQGATSSAAPAAHAARQRRGAASAGTVVVST